ncbi:DUF6082 family protein [Streptomyces sp. 372A]
MQNSSLTLGTAFGVAGLALAGTHVLLAERRHRQDNRMRLTQMHAELSRDTAAEHPDIVASGTLSGLDADELARGITCNRWAVLWSNMLRTGFITSDRMATVAANFMSNPANRLWWRRVADYRRKAVRDKHDSMFHQLMERAHLHVTSQKPAAPQTAA